MLHDQTAHKKSFFFASGRGSAMILGVSARSRTFPGGLFGVPSRLRELSGHSWDVPGRAQTLPGRLQDALGCHGASREPPRADLESILGIPESILDSFSRSTLHNIGQGCPMLPNVARYWVQLRDSAKTCAHLHNIA